MLQRKIGIDTVIVKKEGLDAVDIDDEKVMMDVTKGKYYALNNVGSRIWELINVPRSVNEVISKLLEEYDVDTGTCRNHVLEFTNRMYGEGLVCIFQEN